MDFKYAVVIGRFQPFHNEHLRLVERGLEIAERVIIMIGSEGAAPSPKNPFSFAERQRMIEDCFQGYASRVHLVGIRDYYNNDNAWLATVQAKSEYFMGSHETSVALLGSYKDASSYYLTMFPQWEFVHVKPGDIDGTQIRDFLFDYKFMPDWEGKVATPPDISPISHLVPGPVYDLLTGWVHTERYASLAKEWQFIEGYKESWATAPFPPIFVTADAIVVSSGHVLVVKRKINPGKGLYALPGGFIKQYERVKDAAIRELREETGIMLDKQILESAITASHVFDYPHRSQRGRTITHGFYLQLKDGKLPPVKGGDDAAEALWLPLWDAMQAEDKFFEDHLHIINFFTGA